MEYNFITNIENCYVDIPNLLYYSHIPTAIIVFIFGLFFFLKNKENKLLSIILLLISSIFSIWSAFDIILWRTHSSITMLSLWSLFALMYALLFLLSLYFVHVFVDQQDISNPKKYILFSLLLPIMIATPTVYNLGEFDIENCQPVENLYFNSYQYALGILIIIWILHLIYSRCISQPARRRPILFVGSGILLFLLAFSWAEIVGSFSENFEITQYGLFGAPIFIGFLVYSIVKFKTFNIKLIATQALVWTLAFLIGAQFFFIKTPVNFILNVITFISIVLFGYALVKSVKREIEQKEELAKLNIDLQDLIKQRESLVHLVTHKVKGSFTRSKYIFAGLLDGTFGDITPEVKKYAEQGLVPHGGGCFSGKDSTKVDRSGAYMARFVAKNLVAAGYGKQVLVSVAYAIGMSEPLMLEVVNEKSEDLSEIVKRNFDFRPQEIIERLKLREPIFLQTSTYGHFGNPNLPWEQIEPLKLI